VSGNACSGTLRSRMRGSGPWKARKYISEAVGNPETWYCCRGFIVTSQVRNVFDQYSQPENRLSHALAVALCEDPRLRRSFLRDIAGQDSAPERTWVVEQRLPGEPEQSEEEAERRGLPDLCIFAEEGWALAVESKVEAALSEDQLDRHRRTLQRRGFDKVGVLAITGKPGRLSPKQEAQHRRWTEIYDWTVHESKASQWARRLATYIETVERRMVEDEYLSEAALTHFSGISFDAEHPYTYQEGKRLLKLAMQELRKRKVLDKELGANLSGSGRSSITGTRRDGVWDFIPLKAARTAELFTNCSHLTLSIGTDRLWPIVTVPRRIKGDSGVA
jgi:hypothetical protein